MRKWWVPVVAGFVLGALALWPRPRGEDSRDLTSDEEALLRRVARERPDLAAAIGTWAASVALDAGDLDGAGRWLPELDRPVGAGRRARRPAPADSPDGRARDRPSTLTGGTWTRSGP